MPLSDDEIKAAMHGQYSPPSTAVLDQPTGGNGFSDAQLKALMQNQIAPSEKPPAIFSPNQAIMQGSLKQYDFGDFFKDLQTHFNMGTQQLHNSLKGVEFLSGARDPKTFNVGELEQTPPSEQKDTDTFAGALDKIIGPVVESFPSLGAALAGGATTAAAAGLTGLAAGGAPAAFTAPTGFLWGTGATAGTIGAGDLYVRLRKEGVPDDYARSAAAAFGGVVGAANVAGVGLVGRLTEFAAKDYAEHAATKIAASHIAARLAANIAGQTVLGTGTQMADVGIRHTVGTLTGNASLQTTDWGEAFTKSVVDSLKFAVPLGVATEGTGVVLSVAAKRFVKQPTVKNATALLDEAIPNTVPELQRVLQRNPAIYDEPKPGENLVERYLQEHSHDAKFQAEQDRYYRDVTNAQHRNEVVKQAIQVTRVLPGALNDIATVAKAAEKAGRALTDDEKLALERDKMLPTNATAAKERLDNKIVNYLRANRPGSKIYGYKSVNQSGKLMITFQDVPNPEPLVKALDTFQAETEAGRLHRAYRDMLYEDLSKATGLPNNEIDRLIERSQADDLHFGYINQKYLTEFARGEKANSEWHGTADDAMSYLMWFKNVDAKNGLRHGNGYTLAEDFLNKPEAESTESQMTRALLDANPMYGKLLKGFESWYDRMFDPLANKYKEQTNVDLDRQEFYGGRIYRKGGPEEQRQRQLGLSPMLPWESEFQLPEGAPGFTKERTANTREILPKGAFRNAEDRILRQGQYEAMVEPAKLWDQLINNPDFRNTVKIKYKNDFLRSLESGYRDIIHGTPEITNEYNGWIDSILKTKLYQTLAFKPAQAAKHVTTILNFALYKDRDGFISPLAYSKGLLDFRNNGKAAVEEMSSWDAVKNRYANPTQTAIGALTKPEPKSLLESKIEQAAMKPFVWGDKAALYPGAWSVYKYVLEKTGDKEVAVREASKTINNVLASGMLGQLSDMSRGQVGRLFVQFQQPAMRLTQHWLEASRKAANFPTTENIGNAVYATALTRMSMALFVAPELLGAYTLASFGVNNKEDVDEKLHHFYQETRLGAMFPFAKEGMSSLDTVITNKAFDQKNRIFEPNVAPLEMLDKTFHRLPEHLQSHYLSGKPLTFSAVMNDVIEAVQGPGVAAGLKVPVFALKAIRDMFGAHTVLGGIFGKPKKYQE